MGVRNGRQRLGVDRADESAMFPPNETGSPFVGSIEYRGCDFGHLFEGSSIGLEAGHSSHPLNCYHEEAAQGGRILLGRQFALLLRSPKRLHKDRFYSDLVVP